MSPYYDSNILIIDDEEIIREVLADVLERSGYNNIYKLETGKNCFQIIKKISPTLIFLDLNLPELRGEEILEKLSELFPSIPVIIITGDDDIKNAINTIKLGAYDYIKKPFDINRVPTIVNNAINFYEVNQSLSRLKDNFFNNEPNTVDMFSEIITDDEQMYKIFKYITVISDTNHPILITGETGVGKELFARSIHKSSNKNGDFIAVDTSSYTTENFKDVLFGHTKGAYTGASNDRSGLFKMADNGTLFLDEIGDLDIELQNILLRVIQEGEYRAIGSDIVHKTNCKLVFATNRNLDELINLGKFRKDLYYRLQTHNFEIPPLRSRKNDIPLIFKHYVKMMNNQIESISKEIITLLNEYDYPGNVRELKNIAINSTSLAVNNQLQIRDVVAKLEKFSYKELNNKIDNSEQYIDEDNFPTIQEMTNILINKALSKTNNNQSRAAKLLGISRQALHQRLSKLD